MSDKAYRELSNGKREIVYAEDEILLQHDQERKYFCCGEAPTGKVCYAEVRLRKGPDNKKTKKKGAPNFYQHGNASDKHIAGCPHDERKATKSIPVLDNDASKICLADSLERLSRPLKGKTPPPKGPVERTPKGKPIKFEVEEDDREVEEKLKKPQTILEVYDVLEKNELGAVTRDGRECKECLVNERTYLNFRNSRMPATVAIVVAKKSSNSKLNQELFGKEGFTCTLMDAFSLNKDTRIYYMICFELDNASEITKVILAREANWLVLANWELYEVGGQYKDCVVYKGVISSSNQIVEFKR